MTTTYVGGLSLADAMPGVTLPIVTALGDIQGRLNALLSFTPTVVPPSIAADIQVNAQILANLQASIAITPPSISLQAAIMLDTIALLTAQIAIIQNLFNLLAAGVHVYTYDGQASAMGGELTAELSGGVPGGSGTDHLNALLLIASIPAAWLAIAQLFKTTP